MSRSAYVIGLGGTGQWILTYLKNELMEINKGFMPTGVKLLEIDTQMQDVQLAGADMNENTKLTNAQVGSVRLDPGTEFVQIGGPLYKVIQAQHDEPQSYLDWLDVERLLELGEGNCNTTYGAGAFRQLGRLSLFNSVNNVYARLKQDILDLKPTIPAGDQLEILITGSLAGGTGAGTILDMAWLVRTAADELGLGSKQIRGFIILPTAFERGVADSGKRLRSYAAWKELDRFMNSSVLVKGVSKIVYNPNSIPPLEARCDTNIFDTSYLVDPNRNNDPITSSAPENSSFPVVAHAISMILDEQAGKHYAEHVPNVHIGGALSLPIGTYHSSFGAYTIKIPVQFMRSQQGRELAFAAMEKCLEPEISNTGVGIDARSDQNMEAQPNDIASGLTGLLISAKHGTVNNTIYLKHVDTVHKKGTTIGRYIEDESKRAVDRKGETVGAYTDSLCDQALNTEMNEVKRKHIWDEVLPARDRKITPAKNLPNVVNEVAQKETEWFGQRKIVRDPKNPNVEIEIRAGQGSRNRILQKVATHQLENFREVLKTWSSIQLNGITVDSPAIAKGGKLGYVYAVYEKLVEQFGEYETYLESIKKKVNLNNTKALRIKAVDKALENYRRLAPRECVFAFFDDNVYPKAWDAERNYLRMVDHWFDYIFYEAWIEKTLETVRLMKLFVNNSIIELDKQKRLLITGKSDGRPESRYQGLYNYAWDMIVQGANGLDMELNQGNPNFTTTHELKGVQQLIQTDIAQKHYQENNRMEQIRQIPVKIRPFDTDEKISEILSALLWEVFLQTDGNALGYRCGFMNPATADSAASMDYFDTAESKDKVKVNYQLWQKRTQKHFTNIADATTLDTQIVKDFPDAARLADDSSRWSAPLYNQKVPASAATGAFDKCMFVRVNDTNNRPYFTTFTERIRAIAANFEIGTVNPNVPAGEANSQDKYKITVFRAHHLMPSTDFQLMNDMEKLFIQTMNAPQMAANPVHNFVFAAEKNAHRYALQKPLVLEKDFKPFAPEVVHLLEEERKLILFFLAFAQGILVRERSAIGNTYSWSVPSSRLILVEANEGVVHRKELSIFEIIRKWMKGEDARAGMTAVHSIDWDGIQSTIGANIKKNKAAVRRQYTNQLTPGPESIISIINEDKAIQYDIVDPNHKRFFQSQKYDDLCDLAKIILQQKINDMN